VGHKIHPTGFRLGVVQEHRSRWFAEGTRYPELLQEDHRIREYVQKTLSNAGISPIFASSGKLIKLILSCVQLDLGLL
jgi:small subunit ribosomal protein S3